MSGPWRAPSRLWLVVPVALALAVAFAAAMRSTTPMSPEAAMAGGLAAAESADLARCREQGESAAGDPACRAAWRAARQRFLGRAP